MNALLLVAALAALPEPEREPLQVEDAPLFDRGGRVRFGFSAQAGVQTSGLGFAVDFDVRLGVQATQWWSAYAIAKFHWALNPNLLVGILGGAVEVMVTNHFSIAVGPVLGYGALTGVELEEGGRLLAYTERSGASFKPGFDVKLAVSTGSSRPPRFNRPGLTFGFELMGLVSLDSATSTPSFAPVPVTTPVGPVWLFAPMLSLGADFR